MTVKLEAPGICLVSPMVNPALVQGCSRAGTRGNGVSTPFSRFTLNKLEVVSKWLYFDCVPTTFLLTLHPWKCVWFLGNC